MDFNITIDTLYLHVKFPFQYVFDTWNEYVKNLDPRVLKRGVVADSFVIRNGSSGYKISVWEHDARIYLTDRVDKVCGDGQGMGAWVQLGPKFLIQHSGNLHQEVWRFLNDIGIKGDYPVSITRIDIAIDLLGVSMADQNIEIWKENWVGRSKLSAIFNNSRTGALETFYIGSRKSPVFIRVYDKVAQSLVEGDYLYWRDIWKNYDGSVTRIEWEVKPKDGNFSEDLKDFSLFNGFSVRELLNYLIDWGRLCDPDPNDSNRRRWRDSRFWADLRQSIDIWCDGINWPTSRYGKEFHGISTAYIKFVSGTLSGAMANFNPNNPSMYELFIGLEKNGEPMEKINNKAAAKAAIKSRV